MHYKITLADKIEVLDDNIKTNKTQYNLDSEAAKLSTLRFGELDKYEY